MSARTVRHWTIVCCAMLGIFAGQATGEPVYSLARVDRSVGLPQSSARAVAVDGQGFLWVGTETGIARYDGYRFKQITPSLGNGVVLAIRTDSRNRLWTW